jgi:hypothetical protein
LPRTALATFALFGLRAAFLRRVALRLAVAIL